MTALAAELEAIAAYQLGAESKLLEKPVLALAVTFQVRPHPRWNDGLFVLGDAAAFPDVPRHLDHHALGVRPGAARLAKAAFGGQSHATWGLAGGLSNATGRRSLSRPGNFEPA